MKFSRLHLIAPAHIGGTVQSMLQSSQGWDLELRPDLQGILAVSVSQDIETWIPLSNCRNAFTLVEEPTAKKKIG